MSEIYGVDKKGAYIDYKLEELAYGGNSGEPHWVTVSLSDLEQTKDLKRVAFDGYFKRLSYNLTSYLMSLDSYSKFEGLAFVPMDLNL